MAFMMLKREIVSQLLLEVFVGYFQVDSKDSIPFTLTLLPFFGEAKGSTFLKLLRQYKLRYILVANILSDLHIVRRNPSSLESLRSKYTV